VRSNGDRVLIEFSKILKTVFRGADLAFPPGRRRVSGHSFLDTTEEQADCPVHRLLKEVDHWNLASKKGYELSFNWALAPYVTGSDAEDVLRAVDRKMYSKKHKLTPVF
jgi:GGDEF domain-containing protein